MPEQRLKHLATATSAQVQRVCGSTEVSAVCSKANGARQKEFLSDFTTTRAIAHSAAGVAGGSPASSVAFVCLSRRKTSNLHLDGKHQQRSTGMGHEEHSARAVPALCQWWSGTRDVVVEVVCGRCRTFGKMRKTSISFPGGRGSARGLVQTRHGTLDVSAYRGAVPLERTIQALQSLLAPCSPREDGQFSLRLRTQTAGRPTSSASALDAG